MSGKHGINAYTSYPVKSYKMKNIGSVLTALFFLFAIYISSGSADETKTVVSPDEFVQVTIEELVSDPKQYNGMRVTTQGFVKEVDYTTSGKGEPFTLFKMTDSKDNEIRVYYEDEHLPISEGDKVEIKGRYRKQKNYFLYKIKNVIKAGTVEKL